MKMPVWKCHKEVEAFKIHNITAQPEGTAAGKEPERRLVPVPRENGVEMLPSACKTEYVIAAENPELFVIVNDSYMLKHGPFIGGYYVKYSNGHESFSPAEAFEDGYTPNTHKRVLHIRLGSEAWEPTLEDMQTVLDMFKNALDDPEGGAVITRYDIACQTDVVLKNDLGEIYATSIVAPEDLQTLIDSGVFGAQEDKQ